MTAWYRAGTVSVENGSTTVTGTLTAWLITAKAGDAFRIDGLAYEITAVVSNTEITINPAYAGSTGSGKSYAIEQGAAWNSAAALSVSIAETAEAFQRGFSMTSMTEVEIGDGPHEFSVPSGLPILPGARLLMSSRADPDTHWILGLVTAYEGQTLTVAEESVGTGSGDSRSDWNINIAGPPGPQGDPGPEGDDGWTPALAIEADGERRVLKVTDYAGGSGAEPASPKYVGETGLVDAIGDGVDIRGPAGEDGEGGGASAFTDLTDAPAAYTGAGGKLVAVKDDATGLEFVEALGGGAPFLTLTEGDAPATPDAGKVALYAKDDGKLYTKDDAGGEAGIVAGPASATNNRLPLFDGVTGKLIKDSGYGIGTTGDNVPLLSGVNTWGALNIMQGLALPTESVVIAAGVAAITSSRVIIDTEGAAATDNLDTITMSGVVSGTIILVSTVNSSRDVTIKHATGNIVTATATDALLPTPTFVIAFIYSPFSDWREIFRSF